MGKGIKMAKVRKSKKKVKKNKSKGGATTKKGEFYISVGSKRIVCQTSNFKGKDYLNIRFQWETDDDGWYFEKGRGISIPFNNGVAEEFIEKFKKNF